MLWSRILATVLKKNNKKLFISLLSLLLIMGMLSIYAWITPRTKTLQLEDSSPRIETTYTFKAIVTPNALHPNGGTVDVGDTLYKNITTAIPFDVKTVIHAKEEVLAKGTVDMQLLIKAGDNWERAFPLQGKKDIEEKGTNLSVIDNSYKINLAQVEAFIVRVENETGVKHAQYEIEVVPSIKSVIQYADKELNINIQDKLKFIYLQDEIKLASEKNFTAMLLPEDNTVINSVSVFGLSIPLTVVRIISTTLLIVLFLSIIFSLVYLDEGPVKVVQSEAERLKKKYGKRVIRISKQIDFAGKTVVWFDKFNSILKIADEIEQPIFLFEDEHDRGQMYIVVDMLCVYTYIPRATEPPNLAKSTSDTEIGESYVVG